MDDSDLARYVPHYGDRVALKEHCKMQKPSERTKKEKLLDKLRKKIHESRQDLKRKVQIGRAHV